MRFYALRVVCPTCHTPFLVGGSARHNLTRWRASIVECRRCGADTAAAEGRVVDLHSGRAEEKIESDVGEPCHA